jgi:hypothetical protein
VLKINPLQAEKYIGFRYAGKQSDGTADFIVEKNIPEKVFPLPAHW